MIDLSQSKYFAGKILVLTNQKPNFELPERLLRQSVFLVLVGRPFPGDSLARAARFQAPGARVHAS